jgi:small subunit ribosomal protein S16
MLVIRLQRTGRENLATYRLVVTEKARAVKGKFLEIVGHYLPAQKNPVIKLEKERIEAWVAKGAVPSDTVARMLKREGVKGMDKFIMKYTKQRSKSAPAEVPAAAAPAAPAPAAEAPAA